MNYPYLSKIVREYERTGQTLICRIFDADHNCRCFFIGSLVEPISISSSNMSLSPAWYFAELHKFMVNFSNYREHKSTYMEDVFVPEDL